MAKFGLKAAWQRLAPCELPAAAGWWKGGPQYWGRDALRGDHLLNVAKVIGADWWVFDGGRSVAGEAASPEAAVEAVEQELRSRGLAGSGPSTG